nr:MBL fold metallo-hydrolase [Microcella alkalica]
MKQIYDEDLAHASYLIGCQAAGEAIVVDPRRDVDEYLDLARANGMTITAVAETHIHADYLSGSRELATRAGSALFVSDEGGPDWTYGPAFDDAVRMKDGCVIILGNVLVKAVHTPGHTPEHMSFLVTDGAQADAPGFILTGDFVFVGDVGRPDLLDEVAGHVDTRFPGAKDLFASLRDRFLSLPDYVQVLPAHGAGSACGKALGAIPTSTVGYERAFSWWSEYLRNDDEQGFVDELLQGQPDAPFYFARMKAQNKNGPVIIGAPPALIEYSPEELAAALSRDEVIFVDTRHNREVHRGAVERSLNIPGPAKTASYGAWVYDPEAEHRPLVLLAHDRREAESQRDHLCRVGIDSVVGYATGLEGLELTTPKTIAPQDLDGFEHSLLLDVRNATEYADGHIPGADHISGARVLRSLDRLPHDGTIVAYCQSGVRSSVVASALRRSGLDITELEGSYLGWAALPSSIPVTGLAMAGAERVGHAAGQPDQGASRSMRGGER